MKKNLALLLLVVLSVASTGCKKTNKDEKVTVLDNGIIVVDTGKDIKEENASEDVSIQRVIGEETKIDESISLSSIQKSTNFSDSTAIFNKWITEDEETFINIASDADNKSNIQGDSFEFISKDNTFFTTGRVQGDRIITDEKEIYEYSIYNQKLHITIKEKEYVLNLATPSQEKKIREEKQKEIENLEIPEEEKIDTTKLTDGGWVNKERTFAISFTDDMATYSLNGSMATKKYALSENTITIGTDTFIFTYNLKDSLLYLTDNTTGRTITMEKYLKSDFDNLAYKIYKNK